MTNLNWLTAVLTVVDEQYFDWLCGLVKEPDHIHQGVLHILYETEFFELVPNDHNRVLDGLALRDAYHRYTLIGESTQCSVFEMMIALSRHMDETASAIGASERASYWFWKMMDNLGLAGYTLLPFHEYDVSRVGSVIRGVVNRSYSRSGLGGLFPLDNPTNDQRDVEIWYQMQTWLMEIL